MPESSMKTLGWSSSRWSLKRQIRALGVLFVVTILLACASAVDLVSNSDAARIADAERQLEQAASQLRAHYIYVARAFEQRNVAGPDTTVDNRLLVSITASVLAGMPRVEGGFYFKNSSELLGYAYPTYQGSGPKPTFHQRNSRLFSWSPGRPSILVAWCARELTPPLIRCCFERFRSREPAHRLGPSG